MIHDYGDAPDQGAEIPAEARDLILSAWADRLAYGVAGQHPEWSLYVDDLAQEARYVMWKSASTWNGFGSVVGRMKQEGRWRVFNLIKGEKTFVGMARREPRVNHREDQGLADMRLAIQNFKQTHHREPTAAELGKILGIPRTTAITRQRNLHKVSSDQATTTRAYSLEALVEHIGHDLVDADQHVESVLVSYHRGEIMRAINALPERWRTYIYLRFWEGLTDYGIEQQIGVRPSKFKERALTALAESLAHLVDA